MIMQTRVAQLRFLMLVPVLGLAGCEASTGCDPARAGFVESLSCSNGGFQNRQAVLEQNLAASQANALEQRAAAARAGSEARAAQRDLATRRRELAQLDARLADLRARLQSAESRPGVDQAAVQQASLQLNDLARQQSKLSHQDPSDDDLRLIEDRQRKMTVILNSLWSLIDVKSAACLSYRVASAEKSLSMVSRDGAACAWISLICSTTVGSAAF